MPALTSARGRPAEHAGTEVWDGLRGLAILIVLGYHTWLFSWYTPGSSILAGALRTGYLGVEIFFVISGFVLLLPYARAHAAASAAPATGEFARRRARKIVPSYALALVATVAVAHRAAPTQPLGNAILAHAAFVQNWWDDELGGFNSVFWSLAIEVQFYLVFPALAWSFVRMPYATAAAMELVAFAYRYHAGRCCLQSEPITRQLIAYLDLFASGMLAAYVFVRARARFGNGRTVARRATALALGAVLAWFVLLASADAQTYVAGGREWWLIDYRAAVGLTIAIFGVASSFALPVWRRLVASPVLRFFGTISYNLYLWHTLVLIWMWKHGVPHASTHDPHDDPHWKIAYIACGWCACIGIATASTYCVERPLLALQLGARPGTRT